MKFFTGKGDAGTTGLIGSQRVSKAELRIDAIGSLDELTEFIGNAKWQITDKDEHELLEGVQRDLYQLMAELAWQEGDKTVGRLTPERLGYLEQQISYLGERLTFPQGFILPGAAKYASALGMCRVVTRRAERRLVELNLQQTFTNTTILSYINRLSSLFYLLEVKYSVSEQDANLPYTKRNL
jgi:cob(I)alamin adenosyltransferase